MKKILPHEIDGWVKGETTYKQAVKEFGKPLSYKAGVAKWINKTAAGSKWNEQRITATFGADGILQSYSVKNVPVPMAFQGFR